MPFEGFEKYEKLRNHDLFHIQGILNNLEYSLKIEIR